MKNSKYYISIILPTLNEVENIGSIIKKIINLSNKLLIEIIVVDDASTDGTTKLVKKLSQEDNRIRLINRYGRNGLSSAIKEGSLSASGDIIAVMDTDGQHEVKTILKTGNPIKVIRKVAEDFQLLVVGCSHRTSNTFFKPDISLHLLHQTPCSTLFVPWNPTAR